MATWMAAARAAIGRTNRPGIAASALVVCLAVSFFIALPDHQVSPKVDLKQEGKANKEGYYVVYTGLYFIHYYIYLAIIDYGSDEERDEKVVRYLDDKVPAS
ncbi:hypothetical protein C5167_021692 [Papaver somniferum]|uniref:Uncharacterized protein n=1 Tax=Papaver somniferum TaxID=3469 RepID=A0A4Y7JFT1_PAPSO|nr:hypothetical protein C5167_021692 [Papaver somniferum]